MAILAIKKALIEKTLCTFYNFTVFLHTPCYTLLVMQKTQSHLRSLSERVLNGTLATLTRRPLPVSAHQAAADLYNAVDRYTDAVNHNQLSAAKSAAEKMAVEAMRVLVGYSLPAIPGSVDNVHVVAAKEEKKQPAKA